MAKQSADGEPEGHGADRPLRDGERLVAPTRRPDGTLRKPIRIRAGYTPQDEVAIYQTKGALLRRGQPQVPPGYDPVDDAPQRSKSKSAKKNQKRKEKKQQAEAASSAENGEASDSPPADLVEEQPHARYGTSDDVEAVAHQMNSMSVCNDYRENTEDKDAETEAANIEKRIRALKKKIRAIEALQASLSTSKGALNPEQQEKLSRLVTLQNELSELEAQKRLL